MKDIFFCSVFALSITGKQLFMFRTECPQDPDWPEQAAPISSMQCLLSVFGPSCNWDVCTHCIKKGWLLSKLGQP